LGVVAGCILVVLPVIVPVVVVVVPCVGHLKDKW
jgi:hypothetical protein